MIRLRMMPIRAYAAGLLLLCSSFPAWAQSADEAEALFREGYELLSAGGYAQALEPLGRAKAIYEKLPPSGDISAYMALYLGICHYQLAEYDKALAELREAVTRSDARGFQDVALSSVLYMGNVLFARNEYGLARDLYNDAFERAGEAGMTGYYASIYKGLADVYIAWGKYEDAAVSYRAALAEALSAGDANTELFIRDGLARALFSMGSLDEALEEAEKAHSIALASDSPYLYTVLDTLGIIHMYAGRNLDAENAFLKALNLAAAAGNAAEEARLYVHLGGVRHIRKDWDGAVQAYEQALSLFADLDRPDDESVCLTNLGGTAYAREDFAAAADYFSRSLELKENLRLTAEGFDRVRYQTAQYHVYQYLVLANARQEKWAEAFGIMETVNGRYLRERLGEKVPVLSGGGTGRAFPAFLGDDTAVMAFAGTSLEDYAVIVVTSKGYSGFTAPVSGVASGLSVHAGSFTSFEPLAAVRGLVVTAAAPAAAEGPAFSFYDAVRLYWTSLSVPAGNPAEAEARAAMSREFYGHFIGPVRNSIDGKKKLIVIPDGYMSFLPLETFASGSGTYLVEDFEISYLPNLTLAELLRSRRYAEAKGKACLWGGALYEERMAGPGGAPAEAGSIDAPSPGDLRLDALARLDEGKSLEPVFEDLGIYGWTDLPGTLGEAEDIRKLYPLAEMLTGGAVREDAVKAKFSPSKNDQFEFVHFALHGIVLPDIPEISAMVVTSESGSAEDGYLTSREIEELSVKAETVVLSACETGLGIYYGGEGVAGLAQAFILAGAKGVSVTLWQVSDESTREFMSGVYALTRQGMSFSAASSSMKRRFVNSSRWSEPFFWAPFIFTGISD